jgi:protein-tyrosine-phosphatase
MAAGIMDFLFRQNGIDDITTDSAGIYAQDGAIASQNAIIAALELGVDIHSHIAKRLNEQLLKQSDEIYAMTEQHKNIIETTYPQCKGKVFLTGFGIDDPFGGDLDEYRNYRDQIKNALDEIVKRIKQNEQH